MEMIRTTKRQASFTRPDNATQYAAGDAMGAGSASGDCILEFPPVHPGDRGTGKIISAQLWKSDTDEVADGFVLLLFQKTPTNVGVDENAAPTTSHIDIADAGSYIGSVAWAAGSGTGLAAGVVYETITALPAGGVPFHSADKNGRIFGLLTTEGTHTPAAEEVYTVTLEIQQ